MKLIINKDRSISSAGTWGTVNENDYEILDFEFPAELDGYNKRIVYYLGDERVWDTIVNNKAYITNAITTKGDVKAYVWCTKENTERESDTDFRTMLFEMHFYENENADGIVPTEEQVDGFNTMLTEMNAKIDEVDALETTIGAAEAERQEAEATRVSNENTRESNESTRESNEETRQSQETERERKTDEAIGNIEDKTAEYNANAEAKTNEFNQNATQKTNEFNSNYTQKVNDFNSNATSKTNDFNSNASGKTTTFNDNATSKTNTFNSNASSKTTDFNTNAENKTSAFNTNVSDKTTAFDNNASEKTDEFNTNAQNKIDEYDEHIVEYQAQIDELQEEVDELSENMPWNTTEQATEIQVTDAAKYSRNKLELFGNTEQEQLSGKNLLPNNLVSGTSDGITCTKNADGSISVNGTATARHVHAIFQGIFKAGTYTLSGVPSDNTIQKLLILYNTNTWAAIVTLTNQSATFTLASDTPVKLNITVPEGSTANNILIKPQLEQGSIATDFEPYIGGQSSPSPDHPQPIHVVTGENTIKFYKNLYNPKTAKISSNARQNVTNEILNFEKNKKYYVYANNNTWLTVFEYKGSTLLNRYGGTNNSRKVEFTVSNEADRIIVDYYQGYKTRPTDYTNIYFCEIDEYIEYSDQQYIYPLNLGDIELCQINFYQDTFFKNTKDSEYYDSHLEENGWYLIQKIIKDNYTNVSNNRIEDVTSIMNNGLYGFRFYTKKSALYNNSISSYKEVFCTHFAPKYYGSSSDLNVNNIRNSEGIASGNTPGNIIISLDPTRLSEKSTKAFDDYMKSINPIIAYILTTPIITPITNETLISQLNELYNHLSLVRGTNIATITAADLAPNMQLSYMQDLKSKLDNLDSRLSLLE